MARTVTLTDEAYAMVCGLVARGQDDDYPEGVWHQGVFGPIDEVQAAFPVEDFHQAVKDGAIDYDEDAGL